MSILSIKLKLHLLSKESIRTLSFLTQTRHDYDIDLYLFAHYTLDITLPRLPYHYYRLLWNDASITIDSPFAYLFFDIDSPQNMNFVLSELSHCNSFFTNVTNPVFSLNQTFEFNNRNFQKLKDGNNQTAVKVRLELKQMQ